MDESEIWYRIQRYEWAKENGLLDELFPVVAHLIPTPKEKTK